MGDDETRILGHCVEHWEMFCVHEAFRRLGFKAEDIYAIVGMDGMLFKPMAYMRLKTQDKMFTYATALIPENLTPEKFMSGWSALTEALRTGTFTDAQLQQIWKASTIFKVAERFCDAIIAKGIRIPLHTKPVVASRGGSA